MFSFVTGERSSFTLELLPALITFDGMWRVWHVSSLAKGWGGADCRLMLQKVWQESRWKRCFAPRCSDRFRCKYVWTKWICPQIPSSKWTGRYWPAKKPVPWFSMFEISRCQNLPLNYWSFFSFWVLRFYVRGNSSGAHWSHLHSNIVLRFVLLGNEMPKNLPPWGNIVFYPFESGVYALFDLRWHDANCSTSTRGRPRLEVAIGLGRWVVWMILKQVSCRAMWFEAWED